MSIYENDSTESLIFWSLITINIIAIIILYETTEYSFHINLDDKTFFFSLEKIRLSQIVNLRDKNIYYWYHQ